MAVHILYGNEPYLIDYNKRKLSEGISMPGMNISTFDELNQDVADFLTSYPVFDDRKVAIVHISDVKELGKNAIFDSYLKAPFADTELVIIAKECDKRSKTYKTVHAQKLIVLCDKVTEPKVLEKILLKEVSKAGGRITPDAYKLMLELINYEEHEEVSIYNIISDIHKLVSYNSDITVDSVKLLIKENPVDNVFAIAKLIISGNTKALKQQAALLSDNQIGTLAALLREYRIAWKSKFFPADMIGVKFITLANTDTETLFEGMKIINSAIDGLKNGSLPEKESLFYTFMKLINLHKPLKGEC